MVLLFSIRNVHINTNGKSHSMVCYVYECVEFDICSLGTVGFGLILLPILPIYLFGIFSLLLCMAVEHHIPSRIRTGFTCNSEFITCLEVYIKLMCGRSSFKLLHLIRNKSKIAVFERMHCVTARKCQYLFDIWILWLWEIAHGCFGIVIV